MHVIQRSLVRVLLVACAVGGLVSALAQQTPGAPGAPNATTTIDSRYLPNPPAPVGGVINMQAQDLKLYLPPQIVLPGGAPNVLLIMTETRATT